MFGNNEIRSAERHNPDGRLAVQSIFYTLQGEGPYSGMPAVFVRLAGCNLACFYCDTEFESGISNRMSVDQIIEAIDREIGQRPPPRLVVLTGGEPLRQQVEPLVSQLWKRSRTLTQVETAGTLWDNSFSLPCVAGYMVLVCSPKTPKVHEGIRAHCNHWKYIIRAGEQGSDGLPNRGTQVGNKGVEQVLARAPMRNGVSVWVSPCDDYDVEKNASNRRAATEAALAFGYRLSLQIHKLVDVA